MRGAGDELYSVKPVGVVREVRPEEGFSDAGLKVIEVFLEYCDGLDGLDAGCRLQVLYWMHLLDEAQRAVLKAHPMGDESVPMRGVFTLRSPMRPNPIGSTEVEVEAARGRVLFVRGLDALDGSPVVDLKIAT